MRWSASDPDGGKLNATVDYSADGRSWRTVFDGPSSGRARVPGRRLAGSRRARVRVNVSDGFNEATAVSRVFRVDGSKPTVRILRPHRRESLQAGVRTSLSGAALDDRFLALSGRSLTWFAGRRRLGRGERIRAKLRAGRVTLRLVGSRPIREAGRRPAAGARRPAHAEAARVPLRAEGRPQGPDGAGSRPRDVEGNPQGRRPPLPRWAGTEAHRRRLPRRPATGLVRVKFRLTPRGRGSTGRVRGRIVLARV